MLEHCKAGETLKIHLNPQVKSILNELKETSDTGYVIYGTDNNKPLTENALARAIKRMQERIDYTPVDSA